MPETPGFRRIFDWISLETGLIAGALLTLVGAAGLCAIFYVWSQSDFGPLDPQKTPRGTIPAVTATALGFQAVLSSFFFGMLGLDRKTAPGFSGNQQRPRDSLQDGSSWNHADAA